MRERFGFSEGLCPVSEDASARTMAIPFHARLSLGDQERVVEALRCAQALTDLSGSHVRCQTPLDRCEDVKVVAKADVWPGCVSWFEAVGARELRIIDECPTWRRRHRMIFLGFGKYVRADKIYALEPSPRRRAWPRRPHPGLGRGDRRPDRRLAHRTRDRRLDGLEPRGRGEQDRRRRARSRPAGRRRRRAGPLRRRRPRPPGTAAARVDDSAAGSRRSLF